MSERSAELLLEDMLESCERILEYTKGLSFSGTGLFTIILASITKLYG